MFSQRERGTYVEDKMSVEVCMCVCVCVCVWMHKESVYAISYVQEEERERRYFGKTLAELVD